MACYKDSFLIISQDMRRGGGGVYGTVWERKSEQATLTWKTQINESPAVLTNVHMWVNIEILSY
jgi:hypothetical protein